MSITIQGGGDMKYVLAFQGSPRPGGNTAQLLRRALEGARDSGAETDFVQISSLKMTGCRGCYSCKKKGDSFGKCILKDDMTPLYEKIERADAVLFGSPVYMCAMTPELKMVIDRLFPYLTMDMGSLLKKGKKTALIFTQNQADPLLFEWHFNMTAFMINILGFQKPEILLSVNTIGYDEKDLDRIAGENMNKIHVDKLKYRAESWGRDLDKAYRLGQNIVK
jgi:multimeric flavodoxin WrbA